ncbi:hypothetical protein EKN56_10510 [Limnobaculum zhutongyuii]|uniref:Uncharacterized protein n=1 Tax=Limnobaculum zhutongyuii TaxID=2498113 RepID=A0A411WKX3_9GAMM|nr:hypothetical protein [Limnobaculum zhutongyuii]QBH96800.1 hypothetical protein EKN56_10510 [Limnobaculum zhutongyuii]TQS90169.1 hypothetical protein ELQ32_02080 [Limnobaculum zhutongyuii]
MIPRAIPERLLLKSQPALRHPRYRQVYEAGREARLSRELSGLDASTVPLFSHHGTYQAVFKQGWHSINAQDIRLCRDTAITHRGPHVSHA